MTKAELFAANEKVAALSNSPAPDHESRLYIAAMALAKTAAKITPDACPATDTAYLSHEGIDKMETEATANLLAAGVIAAEVLSAFFKYSRKAIPMRLAQQNDALRHAFRG